MTQQTIKLGGEGGNAFAFDRFGASVTGKIIGGEEVPQTEMGTNEPRRFANGDVMMQTKITLQTTLRDDEHDDGLRNVYLRGSLKPESKSTMSAVREAARAATGSTDVTVGGTLTLTYVSDGRTSQGFTMKQYEAKYAPPTVSLAGDAAADTMPPPTVQEPATAPVARQNGAGDVPGVIGWLDGKPVDATLQAAFAAAGIDPRSMPGFVAVS
jgi:hypothetical protein